jgi:hypothetical protein
MSSTAQTLDAAILDKILPKLPSMTIAQIVRSAVRSTLRQITNDYDLEFADLKKTYLEDGADFYDVAAPVGFATGGSSTQAPPVAPSKSTAIVTTTKSAPTSLSKMKKEDLIRACHELGLDIEGTVPELRARIKEAGGLPTGSGGGAAGPSTGTIVSTKATSSKSSKSSSKKPKVPALPAPELEEEPTVPEPKATKTTKPTKESKKPKKEKPVHDHPIEETSAECQVCETYGNSLVEEATDEPEYVEETKSLRERLTLMLAAEAEADDEDGEEDEEEEFDDQQETQLVEE